VGHFPNTLEALDQSQLTPPADQSEHSVLFRRRGFIETRSKQSDTDSNNGEHEENNQYSSRKTTSTLCKKAYYDLFNNRKYF